MQSDATVEHFYIFKYRQACIRSASLTGTEDQHSFQGSKKRFNAGIVITIAFSDHASFNAITFKALLVIKAGIMFALVLVMDKSC